MVRGRRRAKRRGRNGGLVYLVSDMSRIIFAVWILILSTALSIAATYFSEVSASGRIKRTVVIPDAQAANGETYTSLLLGGSWKQSPIDANKSYPGVGWRFDAASGTFKTFALSIIGDSIISNMVSFGVQATLPAPFAGAQNLGVSGDRTDLILARLGQIASNVTDVILEGGTNDFLQGADSAIIPNYTSILNSLTPTRRVFIIGVMPVDQPAMDQARVGFLNSAKVTAKNAQIATLCASYANCFMTNVRNINMTGKTGGDGIHPAPATYIEIAALIGDI